MSDLSVRDRLVDRMVIRGDCPVEPCASEGWIKIRAVALSVSMAAPGVAISFISPAAGTAVGVVGIIAAVKLIGGRINERIEAEGHTCGGQTQFEGDDQDV